MPARIRDSALPGIALLNRYQRPGGYTDCFVVDWPGTVPLAVFVEAFLTSPVFRLERWVLRHALRKPSTDAEAGQLARGEREAFAAWTVEARQPQQLLLKDVFGTTRCWFMVQPHAGGTATWLHFGSAVVPTPRSLRAGRPRIGVLFRALVGAHRFYSRVLLRAACHRLRQRA